MSKDQLGEVIAQYLKQAKQGESPDRDALLVEHSEVADELRSFFFIHDQMRTAAGDGGTTDATVLKKPSDPLSERSEPEITETVNLAPGREETNMPPQGAPTVPRSQSEISEHIRYFGDYELLAEIARGGMGVVYRARQTTLNRVVALKMILAGQLASQEDVQRFYSEAEAAANLDHPNIVPIFEIGEYEGQHFFSMAYVEGESLADHVADGPLPPEEAAEVTRIVSEAIAYAHQRGVVHRDLKPANILLAAESKSARTGISKQIIGGTTKGGSSNDSMATTLAYTPKVTDFGLAKKIEEDQGVTATGQILGTPAYMPPEQAAGKIAEVAETADVYSLGAILYCLLVGRPPFQAASPMDTLLQVLDSAPIPLRQINPSIPRDLETISLKCLEKDQRKRYTSASELADELARYANDKPIFARPVTRVEHMWRCCRRNPVGAGFIGSVSLLLALLLIGGPLVTLRQASLRAQTEEARRDTALSQVETLLRADSQAVPALVEGLESQYEQIEPRLLKLWEDESVIGKRRARVAMARLSKDPEMAPFLHEYLVDAEAGELLAVREVLQHYNRQQPELLWAEFEHSELSAEQKFNLAAALALFAPNDPQWENLGEQAARHLVSRDSFFAAKWVEAFRTPAQQWLLEPIGRIYRENGSPSQQLLAANLLADFAGDQPSLLVELIAEANPDQFVVLFPALENEPNESISAFEEYISTVNQTRPDPSSVEQLEESTGRVGNAIIALARLGRFDAFWPALAMDPDPRLRTWLIHRCARLHLSPGPLLAELSRYSRGESPNKPDNSIQAAILLALGEYSPAKIAAERSDFSRAAREKLAQSFNAEVASAAQWLQTKWEEELQTQPPLPDAGWRVTSFGDAYIELKPATFTIGSPPTEQGRRTDEAQHSVEIGHRFEVAAHEVTVARFHEFLRDHPEVEHEYSKHLSPTAVCPQTSVTWYEAAAFCNWLSACEGIPKDQWCYQPNNQGQYASGMKTLADVDDRTGYRLPTEAEWEWACRGGTVTSRHFGGSDQFMEHYAWYLANALDRSWPVRTKKPNPLGLFGMQGNVWEWCHEAPLDASQHETPAQETPVAASSKDEFLLVQDGDPRPLRGGSYFYHAIYLRSALRNQEPANSRYYGIGLRPVRTLRSQSP